MKLLAIALCGLFTAPVFAQSPAWPVIKHYDQAHLAKIAMPIGGLGTGDISIGGNGQWKDVEIMNKPAMGYYGSVTPKQAPCFMIFTKDASGRKHSKTLMGPIPPSDYAGSEGSTAPNHGMPRFSNVSFDAAYPFATVNLQDPEMPVTVKLKTFNPFVPGDVVASGIPIAVIRYEVTNTTDHTITAAVAGSLDNCVGMDGSRVEFNSFNRAIVPIGTNHNINVFRKSQQVQGIYMSSDSVDRDDRAWGTIALTTPVNQEGKVTHRTEFDPKGWSANLNDMWDDFSDDGMFRDTVFANKVSSPRAGLSVSFTLAPHQTKEIQFFLTWHFPNRKDWNDKVTLGNFYTTLYSDAWDVAEKTLPLLPKLEEQTLDFVNLIAKSNYPAVVKEAALFNTSTLRSQTVFRTKDGNFFGWEGVFNNTGSCYGNCEHVWNYEFASPFLFGEMAMKMRLLEYNYAQWDADGLLSFRITLPLKKNGNWKGAAADGQMGTIMKTYREWQLSGDDKFLADVWPSVKRALAFAWVKGGWDANKDGVMEGSQHNTMDIEYFGPNPEVEFWYLGALKASAAMARHMKDAEFEATCTDLFNRGSKWTDANLFNGEFYIQKIQPVASKDAIAPGLYLGMGAKDLAHPDFQIGEGCLVDQLVGQNMALICGLGYLADSTHVKKALESVRKYNYVRTFDNYFNNMRSYALGNESGLILTSYPDPSKRPVVPLSYAFEAWTGLEYTAATGMIYEGMPDDALHTITDVRNRFDGIKRNPFNEEECGNHYARAMASWSAIIALSKFNYSAVTGKFTITGVPGNYFWSDGYAWGNAEVSGEKVVLTVHSGKLKLTSVELKNRGTSNFTKTEILEAGSKRVVIIGSKS